MCFCHSPLILRWPLPPKPLQVRVRDPKTAEQQALDSGDELLDYVTAGAIDSWDEVRPQLADLYVSAGLPAMADFVR